MVDEIAFTSRTKQNDITHQMETTNYSAVKVYLILIWVRKKLDTCKYVHLGKLKLGL